MVTTLLNPTLWLLLFVAVSAAVGISRGESARTAFERVVAGASRPLILVLLLVTATGAFAIRAGMAVTAPPRSALEQAAAVKRFLDRRGTEPTDATVASAASQPLLAVPWKSEPAAAGCPVRTMQDQVSWFTTQGQMPTLLLIDAPLVLAGGRWALFAVRLVASVLAVMALWIVLVREAGVRYASAKALLLAGVLLAWQPVVTAVRQADTVLPAAALAVAAWHFTGSARPRAAGVAGAAAACISVPAAAVLAALLRTLRRAAVTALVCLAAVAIATFALVGLDVATDFAVSIAYLARGYSVAATNYSLVGRAIAADLGAVPILIAAVAAMAFTWWRARGVDDAFGAWAALGLVLAPLVWSQQLLFLLVPAAVLVRRTLRAGSPVSLAILALLLLLLSLPDPAVIRFSALLSIRMPQGITIPLPSLALVALWVWITAGPPRPAPVRVIAAAS